MVHGVWNDATKSMGTEERKRRYYDEADKVDFELYRSLPWRSHVWETIAKTSIPDVADLLTSDEIAAWRDRLLRWFTELKEEPQVELQLMTLGRVERFIEICAAVLRRGMQSDLADGANAVSGLEGHDLLRDA